MEKWIEAARVKVGMDGETLEIQPNAQTMEAARKLSDYIHALPLTAEQNNELIRLIMEHVTEAEKGAFVGGVVISQQASEEQEATNNKKQTKYLQ